ncbi:MAG: ethylbenzene dehydrogenase-related protein [Nitrospira sp.]|nr:ethylbenzene dehydrogenase-related protein [Nitrospira sp.]MDH4370855.1 ethylbenzene dehydrogenase-related protein [Nitrospira sp.]MDH5497625.1 ethylbenzene dehydrogenase-related protein [Nitrospira sp.]MDH5726690.1 ethylbenzene dehydrogenase-related protein [Nitrospira sp.]
MKRVNHVMKRVLRGALAAIAALIIAEASLSFAQESVAVKATIVTGGLPVDDPNAAIWSSAMPATFPMSPQVHWPNRIQEVTVKDVSVRALHDGNQVAFLLEYSDPSEDQDDAAAFEFMVGDKKAHFAHGQPMLQVEGGPVNIWFWKHKEGKAVDMTAKGFGTLKPQTHQDVKAKGVYSNGSWKIVFSRSLTTDHPEEDVQITPGEFISIAFAVWDGRKDAVGELVEKGSQKAVSSWWYFRADAPPDYSGYMYAAIAAALALGFQFVLIRKLKKGQ